MKSYEIEVKIECNARVTVISDSEDDAIDQAIARALDAAVLGDCPRGTVRWNNPEADVAQVKSATDLTEYERADIAEADRVDLRVHGGAA
jgi:hypothetical protein